MQRLHAQKQADTTESLEQMLEKFSRAWSRRQRAKWLHQWAWTAIIKGSGIGWHKYHSRSGKAFLNFTFHLWCDLHRANIRKGGRILMAIWRRDLQCLSRASRAWCNKSRHRQRVLRFYFVRCYRRSWDAFVEAFAYERRMRRAELILGRKAACSCIRVALREWSQASWRERALFWRRHCRAAREALRQAMQPSTYNDFLQRTEDVYGAIPGSITLDESTREGNKGMRGAMQKHDNQRRSSSRSIGIMTVAALSSNREDAMSIENGGSGQVRVVRGSPSRQEIHLSPPAASSPPALSSVATRSHHSLPPSEGRLEEREMDGLKNHVWREAGHNYPSGRQLEVPTSSLESARTHKTHPWQNRRFSDSEDDVESTTSPSSTGAVRTITPPSRGRSRPRSNLHVSEETGGDLERRDMERLFEATKAGKSLGRTREREREASRERHRDISPDAQPPSLLAQPALRKDHDMNDGQEVDDLPAAPALCLPNSEGKALLIKWQPQPRAISYELRYRFRRLDNLYWGSWVTMSDSIGSTRTLVPARKDAVYCFQVRAQTARGWGEWSKASAVFRATPAGGMQYAASTDLDGSLVVDSVRTHELAGREGHRSQSENYNMLEPLSTPSRAENNVMGRAAMMVRSEESRPQGGVDVTSTAANGEIAPDISGHALC